MAEAGRQGESGEPDSWRSLWRTIKRFIEGDSDQSLRAQIEEVIDEHEDDAGGRRADGDLLPVERQMLRNLLHFSEHDADDVAIPRGEIVAIPASATWEEMVSAFAEHGHSRVPVYDKSLDTIVGVAYAQEIIQRVARSELAKAELRTLLRPVPFVPETKLVSELLAEFRRDHQKIAIVLDEYGGTAGMVTVGDIVAALVGDMPGELGRRTPEPIRRLSDGRIEIEGTTRVSAVNAELGLDLPEEEDYETLAGFVLSELGRFPKKGESLKWEGIELVIVEASDRKVLRIQVLLPEPQRVG